MSKVLSQLYDTITWHSHVNHLTQWCESFDRVMWIIWQRSGVNHLTQWCESLDTVTWHNSFIDNFHSNKIIWWQTMLVLELSYFCVCSCLGFWWINGIIGKPGYYKDWFQSHWQWICILSGCRICLNLLSSGMHSALLLGLLLHLLS